MKKFLYTFALILLMIIPASAATDGASPLFGRYMNGMLKNYREIFLSIKEKNYELAEIHIGRLEEIMEKVPAVMPSDKKDGTPLDREKFLVQLNLLKETASSFRKSFRNEDIESVNELPRAMFGICMDCHKENRLKRMFYIQEGSTVFSEYMHAVKDEFDIAAIHIEEGEFRRAIDPMKVMEGYLTTLERIIPGEGKSGIIKDRARLFRAIGDTREFVKNGVLGMEAGKTIDADELKSRLNGICVSCHEPETFK